MTDMPGEISSAELYYRAAQAKEAEEASARRARLEELEAGFPSTCTKCGKPAKKGRAYCEPCHLVWRRQLAEIKQEVDIEGLKELSGNLCEICGELSELQIDHNHRTGTFRGLLCKPCNVGLGMFRDDLRILLQASTYLHEHAK